MSTRRRTAATKGTGLVLIDIETLLGGLHDRSVSETASGIPLPPATVRTLLCRAAIKYGLMINGRLSAMSSKQRLATGEHRLMLRAMYRTCAFPGCTHKFADCEVHHVSFKSTGGDTVVEMMIPLCRHEHHDAVHLHGWAVTIDTERTLTWRKPSGEIHDIARFVPLADLDRLPADPEQPGQLRRPPPLPSRRPNSARTVRVRRPSGSEPPGVAPAPTLFDFDQQCPPAA